MRALSLAVLIGFLSAVCVAQMSALPKELELLAPAMASQERLEVELRAFDKAQTELAQGDLAASDELKRARKEDEAKAKWESARARLELVRQAYEIGLRRYAGSARLHNYYGDLLYDYFNNAISAQREWNTAISADSHYAPPYNNLAQHQLHSGSYAVGLSNLDRALELEPKNPDFLFNMVQIYLVNAPQVCGIRGWSAKKVYKQAMKLSAKSAKYGADEYKLLEDYAVNFVKAADFGVQANWKEAAKAWQAARERARNDVERFFCWLNEGRVWIWAHNEGKWWWREKEDEEAIRCLGEALKIRPDSVRARQMLESIAPGKAKSADTPGLPAAGNGQATGAASGGE